MRALFFLLDGASNASSYHRVVQYLPLLRANGIQPLVSWPVPEPLYQRWVERGRGRAPEKTAFYGLFLASRLRDVLQAGSFDVAVIQRDLFPFGPPILERILARRDVRLVYDTDDATYLRPAFTPNSPFQRLRRFEKVAEVVTRARWVSAATEPIAGWARGYNSNVSVVPMALDLATYDRARQARAASHTLTLGWAGTAGGLRYLHSLAPVLRDLASTHDFRLRVLSGGYRQVCLPGVPVDARPWRPETGLEEMARFDIGLVPLDDTPFERAKFPFKLLQYTALKVPLVSAGVGLAASVIHHGENGLLANSTEDWRDALTTLIADANLRQKLGIAGHDTVAAQYTVDKIGPLLVQGLREATA